MLEYKNKKIFLLKKEIVNKGANGQIFFQNWK